MSADRTIRYGLEADARNFIRGVESAELAYRQTMRRMRSIEEELLRSSSREEAIRAQLSDARLMREAAKHDQLMQRMATAKEKQLSKELEAERRFGERKLQEYQRLEQRLGDTVERGVARRARVQQQEQQRFMQGAFQGATRAASQGTGIPLPFIGGGIAGIAGAVAGAAVALSVRKAMDDVLERAQEIRQLQMVLGGATERVSEFLAVGEQFGVTADQMADAARNLSTAIVQNPEQLHALGIATHDANGKLRDNIDILTDTRRVLSEAKGDANTFRIAQELLGRSVGDLIPWIRASEEQIDAAAAAARRAGLVMSRESVEGALKFKASLDSMGRSVNGVILQLGQRLIPMLANVAEAAMIAGDMIGSMLERGTKNALSDIFVIGGIDNLVNNAQDLARGTVNADTARIASAVENGARARAEFNRLMAVGAFEGGGGTDLAGKDRASLADANRGVMDSIRDEIDAIRERAQERMAEMRDALEASERLQEAELRRIDAVHEAEQERHESAIRDIEDETRRREQAFQSADRRRQDEIDGLREQIRSTGELIDLERARADVADAEAELELERRVEVFRGAGESMSDYHRAVRDQQRRVADADKRVAETKKKLEEDVAKSMIEARIRALDQEEQAARRALADYKTGAEERVRAIRDEMALEREATQAKTEGIRLAMQTERERVDDAIKQLERETAAVIKELEARLKAHQSFANAVSSVTVGGGGGGRVVGGGTAVTTVVTGGQDLAHRKGEQSGGGLTLHEARALKEDLLRRSTSIEEAIGYVGRTRTSVENEIRDSVEYRMLVAARGGGGGGTLSDFARGGSLTLARSTLLVDEASMRPFARAAAHAPEPVTFHGEGGGPGVGAVVVHPIVINGREIVRVYEEHQGRRAGRGSGRNR